MNVEDKIKEMNDELRALKTAYTQIPYNLNLYTYELNIQEPNLIFRTVTFNTEDGSNTIATVEGATYECRPYTGGAKFFLRNRLGSDIRLHSIQKGTVTVS